jgi:selenocysteine lyase/cysteine desulfurase
MIVDEMVGLARVVGQDIDVPTMFGSRRYINLDNAASTPALESVQRAVSDFLPYYSSVHRGTGYKSRVSTDAYEEAREVVAQFVGANSSEHVVIFGKNTTEALNKLSYRLPLGPEDVVLISNLEHHSNDLPWRSRAAVKRIKTKADGSIDTADFERLLDLHAGKVKLVSISGASNVTGQMSDIHWFALKAHEAGAQIAVDCAQLAAHRPIDMKPLYDPEHLDYVVLSAHKMYAPFGTGALVGRKDTFDQGIPEYAGGGTIQLVGTEWVDWAPPPDRDEAGSPNVVGAVALATACRTLKKIGFGRIAGHETDLANYALEKLAKIPGVVVYGQKTPSVDRSGVIAFNVRGVPHNLVAAILGYEWGIGVRSGCFCAHPYVIDLLRVSNEELARIRNTVARGSRRKLPGMVRISFGLYNTRRDVDVLAEAIAAIIDDGYSLYTQNETTGDYVPA